MADVMVPLQALRDQRDALQDVISKLQMGSVAFYLAQAALVKLDALCGQPTSPEAGNISEEARAEWERPGHIQWRKPGEPWPMPPLSPSQEDVWRSEIQAAQGRISQSNPAHKALEEAYEQLRRKQRVVPTALAGFTYSELMILAAELQHLSKNLGEPAQGISERAAEQLRTQLY